MDDFIEKYMSNIEDVRIILSNMVNSLLELADGAAYHGHMDRLSIQQSFGRVCFHVSRERECRQVATRTECCDAWFGIGCAVRIDWCFRIPSITISNYTPSHTGTTMWMLQWTYLKSSPRFPKRD